MSMGFSFDEGPKVMVNVLLEEGVIQNVELKRSSRFIVKANEKSEGLKEWCAAYARGKHPKTKLQFNQKGLTVLRKEVLSHMKKIPFGKSRSYKDLAVQSGREGGYRAIGQACGANPFPLFYPCHRVLASTGKIGGFSQGPEIKRRLLQFEKILFCEN